MDTAASKDNLVLEIGGLIVGDDQYTDRDWQSLALVGLLEHGCQSMTGYRYFADGTTQARTPNNFDVLVKLIDLRDLMAAEPAGPWHQCLVHITQPDLAINIQFEYDDPNRWSLGSPSLDTSDYAEALKPPAG